MSAPDLYPLLFTPIFQYRLWGGRALGDFMQMPLPGDEPIGEAWVLSDRPDFSSTIANGALAGQTLSSLMQQRKADILGQQAERFTRFPLLLKFLDVEKMLSVQVHPRDDQTALIPEGDTGKTEAWVVLRASGGARIYAGLKPGTAARDLAALTAANAERYLPSFAPRPGQAVMIEAGTVHSLGNGVLVFEVQENSDTTFRLFDWDHIDAKTGKPRPLQVDKALAAIDFGQGPVLPVAAAAAPAALLDDPHFRLTRWDETGEFAVGEPGAPRVLVCAEGAGQIISDAQTVAMKRGDVALLPAALGPVRLRPSPTVSLFEIGIPEPL